MDFTDAKEKCDSLLKTLPIQTREDYAKLRKQVRECCVRLDDSLTIQALSDNMQRIQGLKDRMTEILADSHMNMVVRKRAFEILLDPSIAVSEESSSDRRKGDAMMRLSEYALCAAEADGFYRYVTDIMRNLESQHETVSRRISCFSYQLKLEGTPGILEEMRSRGGGFAGSGFATRPDQNMEDTTKPGEVDW